MLHDIKHGLQFAEFITNDSLGDYSSNARHCRIPPCNMALNITFSFCSSLPIGSLQIIPVIPGTLRPSRYTSRDHETVSERITYTSHEIRDDKRTTTNGKGIPHSYPWPRMWLTGFAIVAPGTSIPFDHANMISCWWLKWGFTLNNSTNQTSPWWHLCHRQPKAFPDDHNPLLSISWICDARGRRKPVVLKYILKKQVLTLESD